MKRKGVLIIAVIASSLALPACNRADTELSTTTSLLTDDTALPSGSTTSTSGSGESPTTTLRGQVVDEYEVAARISTENGEILYIVVPEGAYTDIDLENFIVELKDGDPELWGVEVFGNQSAADAFAVPSDERTPAQTEALDDYHFVSLVGGDTLRFQGPFEEFGESVIGS